MVSGLPAVLPFDTASRPVEDHELKRVVDGDLEAVLSRAGTVRSITTPAVAILGSPPTFM
jgi:hypothetical protein